MSGMRVHELAKELNVDQKELLDRIQRVGIQVKNHMSTLSDSAVLRIRQDLAEQQAEAVEEKRVTRGVIRRRKAPTPVAETPPQPAEIRPEAAPPEPEAPPVIEPAPPPAAEAPAPPVEAPEPRPEAEAPVATPEPPPGAAPEIPETHPEAAAPEPPPVVESAPETTPEAPEMQSAAAAPAPPAEAGSAPKPAEPLSREERRGYEAARIVKPAPPKPIAPPPPPPPPPRPASDRPAVTARPAPTPGAAPRPYSPRPGVAPRPSVPGFEPPPPIPVAPPRGEEVKSRGPAESEESKKGKARRRKKTRKDEPARIVKPAALLPEIEDEIETTPAATVEPSTAEALLRKKPVKPGVTPPPAPPKAPARKEVFERESLYSRKELAAQAGRRRGRGAPAPVQRPEVAPMKAAKRKVRIDEAITVANLAKEMSVKAPEVIKKLFALGVMATVNQSLDFDTAAVVAAEFEYEVERAGIQEDTILEAAQDRPEDLAPRPPVVTVMGHVDHGKTSLLDAIRHTNVIEGEAGGITQHIGAYYVSVQNGNVTFLDTPGHEAFTAMRARGSRVTDIVILVVAADDGVMQQTIEAINHAKAAGVPIVVAINKVDKPNANVDRVKRQLADQGLVAEEWGGNVPMVEMSAKKLVGIDTLLEILLLQAEIMELKANPATLARGHVIEAKLDKGRGAVATILVQSGTLKAGDAYVCGSQAGRVRNMYNDRGQKLEAATPSMPVEVIGLSAVPLAGDDFVVLADEKQARAVAEQRLLKAREKELSRTSKVSLEKLFEQIKDGEIKEVNIILKTDVQGSLGAISEAMKKLSTPAVKVTMIHEGTGAVNESDILLASASNAFVIGFNVRADSKVQELAESEHVDIRYYDVIYQIIDDVKMAMEGLLAPTFRENVLGRAEVRKVFKVPKIGNIAGCGVTDGEVRRGAKVRVIRNGIVVHDGKIASLRREKDDAREVKAGFECGIGVENFNDVKEGDILEAYELQELKTFLDGTTAAPEKKQG